MGLTYVPDEIKSRCYTDEENVVFEVQSMIDEPQANP